MLHKHEIAPVVIHCCETHVPKLTATKVTALKFYCNLGVGNFNKTAQDAVACFCSRMSGLHLKRQQCLPVTQLEGNPLLAGTRVPELASL